MFGYPGFWQIVIVLLLVVLLFGRGKISDLMGDIAKGITSFKKGLKDGEDGEQNSAQNQQLEAGPDGENKPVYHKENADQS